MYSIQVTIFFSSPSLALCFIEMKQKSFSQTFFKQIVRESKWDVSCETWDVKHIEHCILLFCIIQRKGKRKTKVSETERHRPASHHTGLLTCNLLQLSTLYIQFEKTYILKYYQSNMNVNVWNIHTHVIGSEKLWKCRVICILMDSDMCSVWTVWHWHCSQVKWSQVCAKC